MSDLSSQIDFLHFYMAYCILSDKATDCDISSIGTKYEPICRLNNLNNNEETHFEINGSGLL